MDYKLFPFFALGFSIPLLAMLVYLRRNRQRPGANSLARLSISILGWLALNTLELLNPTEAGTLFWGKLTYLFIASTPVFWLFFVLDYQSRQKWLKLPNSIFFG